MKTCTNPKKNTDENFDWRECECNSHVTFKRKFRTYFAADDKGGVHISVKRSALQTVSINTKSSPLDTRSFKVPSNNSSHNEKVV